MSEARPGEGGEAPQYPELDERFPIGVLAFDDDSKTLIGEGKVTAFQWVSILRNSPASCSESEIIMGVVMSRCVKAGHWVAIEDPFTEVQINEARDRAGFSQDFPKGFARLYDRGLATRVTRDGKAYLQPTEKMAQFFEDKIGFNRSETQAAQV